MNLIIRAARLADVDVICEFNRGIARETENHDLDLEVLRPGVLAMVSDPNKGVYFVAVVDDQVVGQLGITYEWSDWRNGNIWWIQSVYVAKSARRIGVFTRLYEHAVSEARTAGAIGVRLYVEHDNAAAQAAYRKLGMAMTGYQVMEKYPL